MSLRAFLAEAEARHEVLHVRKKLSPRFEVSAIMQAFDNGPLLHFHSVEGSQASVVANVCAARMRLCNALGVRADQLYPRLLESWTSPKPPRIVSDAPVRETVTSKVDLTKLPILTHFEKDAAPYITSAVVHAKSSDGKTENVSIHRLQVLDKTRLAIRLVPRHLYKLWTIAKDAGRDMEVAIAVGLHPAVMLSAASPLPFGVSEFAAANHLLDGKLRLVECPHVDAYAPTEAELVLEGVLSTSEEVTEGPLVDITGTYDTQRSQPIIRLVGIMHRRDYIYQALIPSGSEHKLLMGLPHEALIWKNVSQTVPTVKAVNLTAGGCGWLHAVIAVEKQTEGDPKNALMAAFAAHPSLKHAVVVDADIDIYNSAEVEWAVATRFQASQDMVIVPNARGSTLDPSADQQTGLTSKLGIDATRPLDKPKEKFQKAQIPTNHKTASLIKQLKTTNKD